MSQIFLKDIPLHTYGDLPQIGQKAPDFILTKTDLTMVSLTDFSRRPLVLNVYPSIDTEVCFESVKTFNKAMQDRSNIAVACVSMDLPFALKRIQLGEQLDNIVLLSDFRNREFGELYGLTIADGPVAGLLARAVIILDENHNVVYTELVNDISNPPNYQTALEAL